MVVSNEQVGKIEEERSDDDDSSESGNDDFGYEDYRSLGKFDHHTGESL